MAGPVRSWAICNDPDHEWTLNGPQLRLACSITTSPGSGPLRGTEALDVTNPPRATRSRGCRCRRLPTSTPPWPPRRARRCRAWRDVPDRAARLAFDPREAPTTAARSRRSVTSEMGKTIGERPRRGRPHDRDGRGGCAILTTMQGPSSKTSRAGSTRRIQQLVGVSRDRPLQLPGDGALLVPAVRDRARQHLRAEAVGAGAADAAARSR